MEMWGITLCTLDSIVTRSQAKVRDIEYERPPGKTISSLYSELQSWAIAWDARMLFQPGRNVCISLCHGCTLQLYRICINGTMVLYLRNPFLEHDGKTDQNGLPRYFFAAILWMDNCFHAMLFFAWSRIASMSQPTSANKYSTDMSWNSD